MSTGSDVGRARSMPTAEPSQAGGPAGEAEARAWPEAAVHWLDALPQGSARLGRYTVLERVATGGMAVVYAAYDPELDRKVAIKLLRDGVASKTVQARIVREARAMAKLSHPNVAQVFEVGEYLGSTFIAMEFVPGVTLRQWQQEGERSWREVLGGYLQAGRGLAAAHAEGLVHRDFKPDNAMIGRDGRVRVLDFGLVWAGERGSSEGSEGVEPLGSSRESEAMDTLLTKTGSMLGTPAYMAPEQLMGESVDHRVDQFGFCVSLWEALLGERPFSGETREALVTNVVAGQLREPPKDGRLPPWVRSVLLRGLAVDPDHRFPTMNALLSALEADPSRRRRRVLAAGVGAAAVALAIAGYGLDRARRVQACEEEAASIEAVWSDEARERVRASLLATGKSYAQSTWDRVGPQLDAYAAAWSDARASTCLAAEVERTRSATLATRARECLDGHRDALASLVDVLGDADEPVVRRAAMEAAALPWLEECTDDVRLAKRLQPPDDPEVRAAVLAMRKEIAQVAALSPFGRLDDGRRKIEDVVGRAEALGWTPLEAEALLEQAWLARRANELELAEQIYERAFELALREGHDDVAQRAAYQVAFVTGFERGRPERGRWWCEIAVALAARLEPTEGARTTAALERLGNLHNYLGDHARAVELLERALAIRERVLGPVHPTYAEGLRSLADARIAAGALDEAVPLLERALSVAESALGSGHPELEQYLRTLAVVRRQQGQLDEAKALAERGVALAEAAYGADSYHVADELNILAAVEHERGDTAVAEAIVRRALDINTKALGPEHTTTANMLVNLAVYREELGELAEVEALFERALAIFEKALGPERPEIGAVLANMGHFHDRHGSHAEAAALFERALAIHEKALGPDHLRVATAYQDLAAARRRQGAYQESKQAYQAALAVYERTVGLGHPHAVAVPAELGEVLVRLGEPAAAKALLERALPRAQALAPPDDRFVALVVAGLAEVALRERRFDEALSLARRAATLAEGSSSEPGDLAHARFVLAQAVLEVEGDRARALALAEQARDAYAAMEPEAQRRAEVEAWLAARRRGPPARASGSAAPSR